MSERPEGLPEEAPAEPAKPGGGKPEPRRIK